MTTETTGVPTLDAFLGGGLLAGDNVVWVDDDRPAALWFCRQMLGAGSAAGPNRFVSFGGGGDPPLLPPDVEVVDLPTTGRRADPAALATAILALDHPEGSRIVFDGLDALVARWGAPAALQLYTTVCPRLFERGALAYWTGSREWLSNALLESITRIAQCVFDVRDRRLRVAKAEGRPAQRQGALVDVERRDDGTFELGREHVVGRVGAGMRRVRQARNLTQSQIATLANVTPAAISQTESGRRGLSLETLVPLCETLGIGLDDLLGTAATQDVVLARRDRLAVGHDVVALFDDPARGPRTYLVRLDVGESGAPPFTHKGVELVLVASGLVLLDTGDSTPVMRAGDAVMVRRVVIERWTNLGDEPAQLFWVASDASSSAD